MHTTIGIFESNNIILTQITSRLHFNDFKGQFARVAQTVNVAERDESGLVFAQQKAALSVGDFGGAFDHHPMLGTVVVHLQAEACAGVDHNALDLKALAAVNAVIPAPGTVDFSVGIGQGMALGLEPGHDVLDALGLAFVGHQHCVGGFDDDDVVQADASHQAAVGHQQGVGAVVQHGVAHGGVVAGVARAHVPQGVPGAQVRPARLQGQHAGGDAQVGAHGQALHDGVVDGIGWAGAESGGVGAHKVEVAHGMLHGLLAGLQDVGAAVFQGLQPDAGAHHEQSAVPEVFARIEVAPGGGGVGFFSKAGDAVAAMRVRSAALDVAVTGFGPVGHDAKGDHGALASHGVGLHHGGVQGGPVSDDVVGGHGQQDGVCVTFARLQGGQGQGRSGVAARRFEQDARVCDTHAHQLPSGQKTVLCVADDDGRSIQHHAVRQAVQAQRRVLQHGVFTRQGQKLLGIGLARERPQARAGTTAQNNGDEGVFHALVGASDGGALRRTVH